jgi:hypothetical protein
MENSFIFRALFAINALVVFPPVAPVQTLNNLRKNLPNRLFRHILTGFPTLFNQLAEVPLLTVFHNHVDPLVRLVDDSVVVFDDVGAAQVLQDVDF